MYASDLTHKKRAAAIFRNLQLQKDWFASGGTIRILGQKGGNDYAYMIQAEEGCVADKCWTLYVSLAPSLGNGPISSSIYNMNKVSFTGIYDSGYGTQAPIVGILDDAFIPIPMGGMDFFFNEVNYGATNNIFWYSNNALIFGGGFNPALISVNADYSNAILMGNYDRLCSSIYNATYAAGDNKFTITRLVIYFADYYTNRSNFQAGQMQIRMIKESGGEKRQWVEVGIISAPPSPGYSNDPSVPYPSGAVGATPVDSNGNPIDTRKNSPWDISNGKKFLNVAGKQYATAFPPTGTTLLYESDSMGNNWKFTPNAYLNI